MTETITAEELCLITGLTDRRHRQLAEEGHFPPPIKGDYQTVPTLQGLWKYIREAATNTLAEENLKRARADRKLAELKLRRAQHAVIPARSVESAWVAIITTARQRLVGLPAKMVGGLAVCTTPGEQQTFMQREVDDVLSELAKSANYKFADEDSEQQEDDAPEHTEPTQSSA